MTVKADTRCIETSVPCMPGMFAPVIEAKGRRHAGRLLPDGRATA